MQFLIMNECITSEKKPPKLHKCQHFLGFQLARGAPVLLFRAPGVGPTSHKFHGRVHLRARLHSGPLSYGFGIALHWE